MTTTLPDSKTRAVVLGSRMRMTAAAKRLGLYSTFRACSAIVLLTTRQPRSKVATTFWSLGIMGAMESDG